MKRCPDCGRNYNDDSMSFCLDDGSELLFGPASMDEPATAILDITPPPGEAPTRAQIHTTDQTAIFPSGIEAEPQNSGGLSERQSLSENRAAKPQGKVGGRQRAKRLAVVGIAVLLLVGGFFGYRYFAPANSKQIESIAVMPFVNDSGNPDVEYLSDGMTETLMSSLTQVPNLQVKPRSSVFRYKGKETDPKTIGKELNVQAILNGRLVQRGNDITLYVELIDVQKDTLIWKGDYSRSMANLVSLQSEVARDVSNKLKTKLSGADVAKVEKGYTANPEAYRLYLQGRFYWNKRTAEDLKKSIGYFDQAIARDPGYALAYSGLGAVYQVIPGYTLDPPPNVAYPKAQTASLKALEIDPTLAEPHATLAVALHEYEWKHQEAESEFKRAIELDPNYPSAHQWYGNFLLNMGRFQEAIAELERAIELDPLSPVMNANLGRAFRADHRYDDAISQYKKTLELVPNFQIAQFNLNKTYLLKGMYEEVIEQFRQNMLASGLQQAQVDKEMAELKDAYRTSGAKGFWEKVLERRMIDARASGREPDPYELAGYQLGAGNKEQALDSLEKAVVRGPGILSLKAEPTWDPLRAEPRFKELLRKIGLPE